MIKKIELEIDCTEAVYENFAEYLTVDIDGVVKFHKKRPEPKYGRIWDSHEKILKCSLKNWKDLCFKIAQNKPVWLTKEYEERLTERGWKYVWCMPEGIWVASISEPSIIDEEWVLIGFETDYFDLYNDLTENPDWKDSLIKLGE